jgi:O-antigen/teichoic acid export membrane protein
MARVSKMSYVGGKIDALKRLAGEGMKSPVARKLMSGTIWSAASTAFGKLATFTSTFILARIFGPEWLGRYSIVITNANFIELFAASGTQKMANRASAQEDSAGLRVLLSFYLVTATLMAVFVFVFANWISDVLFRCPGLGLPLRIVSAIILLQTVVNYMKGALSGRYDFRALAFGTAIGGVVTAVTALTLGLKWGVPGAVIGNVVGAAAIVGVLGWSMKRKIGRDSLIPIRITTKQFYEQWKLFFPFLVAAITYYPVNYVSVMMMARSAKGPMEVGLYQAAMSGKTTIALVAGSFLAPFLTGYLAEVVKDSFKWERLNVFITAGAVIITALPLALFPEALALVFGRKFPTAELSLVVAAVAASYGVTLLKDVYFRRMLSISEISFWGYSNIVWGCVVVAMIFFAGQVGALEVARAYIFADVLHLFCVYLWTSRLEHLKDRTHAYDLFVFVTAACLVLAMFLSQAPLAWRFAAIPVFAIMLAGAYHMRKHA